MPPRELEPNGDAGTEVFALISSPIRRIAFLVLLVAVGGACAGAATASPSANEKPYRLVIDKTAAEAAGRAGFDLERLLTRSADRVFALIPHRGQIRINVRLDPKSTVPEIGVGAIPDPGTGEAYLTIDDHSRIGFRASLATWLPASLARVLFLSSRIRTGPGYGITLGEALVSEGLSDHFVDQAFPRTPSPAPRAARARRRRGAPGPRRGARGAARCPPSASVCVCGGGHDDDDGE